LEEEEDSRKANLVMEEVNQVFVDDPLYSSSSSSIRSFSIAALKLRAKKFQKNPKYLAEYDL
jgi:hypothetical protein